MEFDTKDVECSAVLECFQLSLMKGAEFVRGCHSTGTGPLCLGVLSLAG